MGNLFQILFSTLKAKITPVWTKIKLWTNRSFIRTRIFTRIRRFFTSMLDIRPRDKKDYYALFGWLISKRLAIALTVILGLVSVYYLFVVNPPSVFTASGSGIKTYSYKSVPLRFTKGEVRILAKSRYVAYEGQVEGGAAKGKGRLYREDGSLVYEGQFESSRYNGEGKLYYPSGQIRYTGSFSDNLFNGTGKLYRENGSMEYDGAFLDGQKEGVGLLYDSGGKQIFAGNFAKDRLLYTDFLGKTTAEARDIYTGTRVVYTDGESFAVSMPDIEALYYGKQDSNSLDDSIIIEGIYILEDSFWHGGREYGTVSEVEKVLGKPVYEGNAYLTMPEAVAVHVMNQAGSGLLPNLEGEWNAEFSDAVTVESYDRSYTVYLYTYVREDLRYTFFCKDRTGIFSMYLIEKQ